MSSLSLRLPKSLHEKLRELSERDEISINQFIATAVAEKAAALMTVDYLEARGGRARPYADLQRAAGGSSFPGMPVM